MPNQPIDADVIQERGRQDPYFARVDALMNSGRAQGPTSSSTAAEVMSHLVSLPPDSDQIASLAGDFNARAALDSTEPEIRKRKGRGGLVINYGIKPGHIKCAMCGQRTEGRVSHTVDVAAFNAIKFTPVEMVEFFMHLLALRAKGRQRYIMAPTFVQLPDSCAWAGLLSPYMSQCKPFGIGPITKTAIEIFRKSPEFTKFERIKGFDLCTSTDDIPSVHDVWLPLVKVYPGTIQYRTELLDPKDATTEGAHV